MGVSKDFQAAVGNLVLCYTWKKWSWVKCTCLFHCCLLILSDLFGFPVKKMSLHEHCISLGLTVDFCNPWAKCAAGWCPVSLAASYRLVPSFPFPGPLSSALLLDLGSLLKQSKKESLFSELSYKFSLLQRCNQKVRAPNFSNTAQMMCPLTNAPRLVSFDNLYCAGEGTGYFPFWWFFPNTRKIFAIWRQAN